MWGSVYPVTVARLFSELPTRNPMNTAWSPTVSLPSPAPSNPMPLPPIGFAVWVEATHCTNPPTVPATVTATAILATAAERIHDLVRG